MSRIPTREFDLTLRLRYQALEGWDPVAAAYDFEDDHEPTQQECVRSQVLEAISGVLPDVRGDEAATLVECEIDTLERERSRAARGRVPTRKQYESLLVLARLATALVPSRKEFLPLLRNGWTEADLRLPVTREAAMMPQRITPDGLRALADAMERYEGSGS